MGCTALVPPGRCEDNVYGDLRDEVATYVIVHAGTLVFIGLMGLALYMLVRDLPGKAATISRMAIGPFVLFYEPGRPSSDWRPARLSSTRTMRPRASDRPCLTPSRACRTTRSWETPASWRASGR
jgi:hypothetical protein